MNRVSGVTICGATILWLLAAGPAARAEVPEPCRQALVANSVSWALARLSEAEAALDRGDTAGADAALEQASTRFPRAADVSISPRCLGREPFRRVVETGRRLALAQADEALAAGNRFAGPRSAVAHLVRAQAADRLAALLDELPVDGAAAARVAELLEREMPSGSDGRALGVGGTLPRYDFETPPDWLDHVRSLRGRVAAVAGGRVEDLLAEEARRWEAPLSEVERQAPAGAARAESLLAALAGTEDAGKLLPEGERPAEAFRAGQSYQLLGRAVETAGPGRDGPARARAGERGDRLAVLARDEGVALDVRDTLFQFAAELYTLAGRTEAAAGARAGRESLQPRLAEFRAERDRAAARYAEKMRERLPSEAELEAAERRMMKSDEERSAFEAEAQAMEDELGF